MFYLSYTAGQHLIDISSSSLYACWQEANIDKGEPVHLLLIIFKNTPQAKAAACALEKIEEPITFIYGPIGNAPGAEKLFGTAAIRPHTVGHIVTAMGHEPLERGYFS